MIRPEPMTSEDLDEILAIERSSFARPWTREMFLREISSRTARALVFRDGNAIVGYLCFWEVLDEAHLMVIAVRPERRGEGHGKAILAHLEKICLQDGLKRIILEVGRRNSRARALYKQSGFRSIGFRKQYYAQTGDDAMVMEKWIHHGEGQSPSLADTEKR
ncbi:MAG: ribosomal protein S18-alanine N-acetyltransferase [Deltaproteobacteria bacterium]